MTGTVLNAAAILLGATAGLTLSREISAVNQGRLKTGMAVFVVYAGLSAAWSGFNGTFGQVLGQMGVVAVALIFWNMVGKLLRLQKAANHLGRHARDQFARVSQAGVTSFGGGFVTCAIVFCVGPISLLGALLDGFAGDFKLLAVKSLMDGLAAMAFARVFGWGVLVSAVPVLAWQGSVSLAARALQPVLLDHALLDSVFATSGLLVCCLSLIILEVKKVRLADYVPSLAVAPLLTWWLH